MTRPLVLLALLLFVTADSSEPATVSSGTDQLRGLQATSDNTLRVKSKPELCITAGYERLGTTEMMLVTCSALRADRQEFEMRSDYTIRVKSKPDLCFYTQTFYGPIELWNCTAAQVDGRQFEMQADGTIRVKSKPDMCLNVETRTGRPGDSKEGDGIRLRYQGSSRTCSAAANEQFLSATEAQVEVLQTISGYELQSKWDYRTHMCGDSDTKEAAGAADCASKCDAQGHHGQGDWDCEGFGFKASGGMGECLLYKDSTKCNKYGLLYQDYAFYTYKKKVLIAIQAISGYEPQTKWNMCKLADAADTADAADAADCASKCDAKGHHGQGDWECGGFGFKASGGKGECLLYKDSTKCNHYGLLYQDYAFYKYKKKGCQWVLNNQISEFRQRDCKTNGVINEASRSLARIHAYTFFGVLFAVFARRCNFS